MRRKNAWTASLALLLLLALLSSCGNPAPQPAASPSPPEEAVTITVAGAWSDCRALDVAAAAFTERYPGCQVVYEYLQDYDASLVKRMGGDAPVDLFFCGNLQADSPMQPFALELRSRADLDLSQTFPGLLENFSFRGENGDRSRLYAIPLGAEMRGMFINVTLLQSLGLSVPTDQASLLEACRVLKEQGYIPIHGNPGNFGQIFLYPWFCNLVANAADPQAVWDQVNSRQPGAAELFRQPMAFLYQLIEAGYYDYKRAQTEQGLFLDTTDESYALDFLNIRERDGVLAKADDLGRVAFMPAPMSMLDLMGKTREDYHSDIEYVFVPAPVGADGGFAYLSPARGIAVNKDSPQLSWAVRFLDFLFQPENNQLFAEAFDVIPNTKDAFAYIRTLYDVPDSHISHLGQVTFDFDFYERVHRCLLDLSKANNPKYMRDNGDGTVSLYPLSHYMGALDASLAEP